ncbi:MAG: choice-of-anchor A family protein [Tepidisphaera sp.]
MSNIRSLAAAMAVGGIAVSAAQAGVINSWNLIVLNNWNNNSQDVEGNAFCGGNFTGGSPTIAKNLSAGAWLNRDSLAVVGTTTVSNINLQAGNFAHGGAVSGNVNRNGGGVIRQDNTLGALRTTMASEMVTLSSSLRSLAADSVATFPGGQPGAVRYTANAGLDGIAVFSVNAGNVFNNSLIQQIELDINGASQIVINVAGTTVNFNNGNMVGSWTSTFARTNVIWNFFEATTISLDRNFNGAILAPLAHLTNSTAIDGSVFVSSFNQSGEVHLPFYGGNVPTPGTFALLGLGALAAGRRRR